MIRSELVTKIARDNPNLTLSDAERVVDAVFDTIIEKLAEGGRIELRGFGAFTVKHRDRRQGRNPRTGAAVEVDPKAVPFFKAGKELRDRLNAE